MPGRFKKLRFWSTKSSSCQACKGQPTPPPCYNCVLGLETPPPKFTDIHEELYNEGQSSLYPINDEYTYPEDAGIIDPYYYQEGDDGIYAGSVPPSGYGENYAGNSVAYDRSVAETTDNFEVQDLSRAVGNIDMAFLPQDHRGQNRGFLDVQRSERTRHRSSPVFSYTPAHSALARTSSTSRFDDQDVLTLEDDRDTITGSNRSLLEALALPSGYWNDDLQEPLSPRGASPLPCQLFIPE